MKSGEVVSLLPCGPRKEKPGLETIRGNRQAAPTQWPSTLLAHWHHWRLKKKKYWCLVPTSADSDLIDQAMALAWNFWTYTFEFNMKTENHWLREENWSRSEGRSSQVAHHLNPQISSFGIDWSFLLNDAFQALWFV